MGKPTIIEAAEKFMQSCNDEIEALVAASDDVTDAEELHSLEQLIADTKAVRDVVNWLISRNSH